MREPTAAQRQDSRLAEVARDPGLTRSRRIFLCRILVFVFFFVILLLSRHRRQPYHQLAFSFTILLIFVVVVRSRVGDDHRRRVVLFIAVLVRVLQQQRRRCDNAARRCKPCATQAVVFTLALSGFLFFFSASPSSIGGGAQVMRTVPSV